MSVKTWDSGFKAPVKGLFFGNLNVSITVPEGVANRAALMDILAPGQNVTVNTPLQWHSKDAILLDTPRLPSPEGDALVTDRPELPVGVVTADCAPVLFQGVKADGSPAIGAAHAGARGAARGIIASTVKAMRELGAENIEAVIGPCIHKDSYEVGTDFQDEIIAEDHAAYRFFTAKGDDKFLFDLPAYVQNLLEREGVPHRLIAVDTYADPDCFSYRRATHEGAPDYGRQLSAIMISGR